MRGIFPSVSMSGTILVMYQGLFAECSVAFMMRVNSIEIFTISLFLTMKHMLGVVEEGGWVSGTKWMGGKMDGC